MSQQQPLARRLLNVTEVGDVTVVTFAWRKILDEQVIRDLREQLHYLVEHEGRRKILLNFRGVELMSSAMFGSLLTLHRLLQRFEGRVVFCELDPTIQEVFEITRLARVLTIHKDEQGALQSLQQSA